MLAPRTRQRRRPKKTSHIPLSRDATAVIDDGERVRQAHKWKVMPHQVQQDGRIHACCRKGFQQLDQRVTDVLKSADDHIGQVADKLELEGARGAPAAGNGQKQ